MLVSLPLKKRLTFWEDRARQAGKFTVGVSIYRPSYCREPWLGTTFLSTVKFKILNMEYQHILKMFDLANLDLGIYVAASVVTIIALAISTRYALSNLLNSNSNGIEIRPKQVDLTAEKTSTPQACDGIDHGDKENKDGEVKPDGETCFETCSVICISGNWTL